MRTRASLSASGWRPTSSTRAVTMPAMSSPTRSTVSISSPAAVSRSASVVADTPTSTCSASQDNGTRMVFYSYNLVEVAGRLATRGHRPMWGEFAPPTAPKGACAVVKAIGGCIRRALDAGQPAEVVVAEGAQVGQAGAEHVDPFHAHPEREAGDPVGVVAAVGEHPGVDHAGPEDLDPAL